MKIKNKILGVLFAFFIAFWANISYAYICPSEYRASFPLYLSTSVNNNHIQWIGSTDYSNAWNKGIQTWNNEGAVSIGYISNWWLADLEVEDVNYQSATWAGKYYKWLLNYPDTIKINKIKMEVYDEDEDKQQNVMTHELGHALGLKHSYSGNIMTEYYTDRINLG